MAATYNVPPVTARDYVRFLVGDTTMTAPKFQDEELDAILSEQSRITGAVGEGRALCYFAAAAVLEISLQRPYTRGAGFASASASRGLAVSRGLSPQGTGAIENQVRKWRAWASRMLAVDSGRCAAVAILKDR